MNKIILLLLILVELCISCNSSTNIDKIPYVPFDTPDNHGMAGYFSNAKLAETFSDYTDLLAGLSDHEKMVVGDWRSYDAQDDHVIMDGYKNIPAHNYLFYPNKIAEISISVRDGTKNRLEEVIGLWEIEKDILKVTCYAIGGYDLIKSNSPLKTTKHFVKLITPYTIDIINISSIDPLGYTKYRINQLIISPEIIQITEILPQPYRPYMFRILRNQYPGLEPEGFNMPNKLGLMVKANIPAESLVRDISFLKYYWNIE